MVHVRQSQCIALRSHWQRAEVHAISYHSFDPTVGRLKFPAKTQTTDALFVIISRRVEKEHGPSVRIPGITVNADAGSD